ncbi:MAG: tetratricopeptide repeat protein [Candidatus Sumerlaeia bacterium]|nr:tetratricopeptide repeat protein [Candidatus Sumerlaeia bacterium]
MGKIKITKKDLKEDEVKSLGVKLAQAIRDNSTYVIIGVAIIVAGLIAVKLYQYRQNIVLRESNKLLTIAMNIYERGLMQEDDPKRREDYLREAIRSADQILRDFAGAKVARFALYLKGNAYYMLNEFDQAITVFQQYVETAKDNLDQAKGYIALGYCFENKFFYQQTDQGMLQQAMRAYEKAIELGKDTYLAYEGMFCKARLLELAGKKEQALAIYEQILKDREFVIKDFEQRSAEIAKVAQRNKETSLEQQIIQQIYDGLRVFTFYKTAEMEITRLRGEKG